MSVWEYAIHLFTAAWDLVSLEWPGLGLSIIQVYCGVWLLRKSISFLEDFFGMKKEQKGDDSNS